MLNMTNMVKAPMYDFQVFMVRNRTLNAAEAARSRMVYVKASNSDDAKKEGKRQWPEFHPVSVRRES